jgi:hypothetical protein
MGRRQADSGKPGQVGKEAPQVRGKDFFLEETARVLARLEEPNQLIIET